MVNNLPSNVPTIEAFQDSGLIIFLDFEEDFVFPLNREVKIYNERKLLNLTCNVSVNANRCTLNFPPETIKKLPIVADWYLVLGDIYLLGGKITPRMGTGSTSVGAFQVNVVDGIAFVIQIPGYSVIAQLTAQAEAAKVQTALDRAAVTEMRDEIANSPAKAKPIARK